MNNQIGNKLSGQVALVTGGSRGIGSEICKQLCAKGAIVYVNYSSNALAAEEVVKCCNELPGKAFSLGFNVGNFSEVEQAIEKIKSEQSKLDILVTNAGITADGLIMRYKEEDWDRVININLKGVYNCVRAASKMLLKSKSGRVVTISSMVGEMGNAGQVAYAASKAGIIGLTKSLAKEFGSRAVTVNCITPGFIETEMTAKLDESIKQNYLEQIPLGRYGTAKEVANLVGFLASEDASYITGQIIGINGGLYT